MATRFLHAADIHLGNKQYHNPERYNDFARAFERLVDDALARRVDFLLLAGDLFHQRSIEPRTLLQASECLQRLREGGVPAIAIEGNHERPFYEEPFSWLDYLVETGLLVLLNVNYQAGELSLPAWNGTQGAFIDLPCGVRVIGAKYYGGSTGRVVQDLAPALAALPGPRPAFTILMMHAGIQGILDGYAATLTRAQLDPLRPYVDYLALGHIHKPFSQDGWLYNPGSLETNSTSEVAWDDRGYLAVEIDPALQPAHRVTPVCGQRRAFEQLAFSVDPYENATAFYAALDGYLGGQATSEKVSRVPVVELLLKGRLAFNIASLEMTRVQEMVESHFHPLVYLLKNQVTASEFEVRPSDELSRDALECFVLSELLERDVNYRNDSARWAKMALRLKELALERSAPGEIIAELRAFCAELGENGR